ncbi:response regulator transcription factor [Noviherbaspirillum cavernae]|uniref:response regulator transcription factor n=1 Tax=Noviherbaspirillum cavernae TaxID=2320862 RepID=UPI001313DEB6|nr:response regulator [Noviherbaspirillum cavernae]
MDDEVSVRKALLRLVRAAGRDARMFATAREFLDTLPYCSYDCVVLDLHMPGMSGFDVLRDPAFVGVHIPTVIISADDDSDIREECIDAGVSDFLCKPFGDQELLDAIDTAMRKTFPL